MNIVGLIHQEKELFGITFPDLPGCVSVGDSVDDVLAMGAEALGLHLEGMVEDGDELPDFHPLDHLEADHRFHEDFVNAVFAAVYAVDISEQTVIVHAETAQLALKSRFDAAE